MKIYGETTQEGEPTPENLFDTGEIIKKEINYIKETSNIINTEMNEFTLKYLNNLGIYLIDNKPIIINNNLENYQIKINKE